jgi:hypothetical protein
MIIWLASSLLEYSPPTADARVRALAQARMEIALVKSLHSTYVPTECIMQIMKMMALCWMIIMTRLYVKSKDVKEMDSFPKKALGEAVLVGDVGPDLVVFPSLPRSFFLH